MKEPFSKRHGFRQSTEAPITVREDAPHDLRGFVIQLAYECGFRPNTLRPLICRILHIPPDYNNWTEYPNIDSEVRSMLGSCKWFRVYDIIEAIVNDMRKEFRANDEKKFEAELNDYFFEIGIGWKLTGGHIEMRGDAVFERALNGTHIELRDRGLPTAAIELNEALQDLSRRPNPDITGAIQHSMAALECVARKTIGDEKATLGEILKRYPSLVPQPLDQALTKLWGFASENARHVREGIEPTRDDAELIVTVVAGVSTYLARKNENSTAG